MNFAPLVQRLNELEAQVKKGRKRATGRWALDRGEMTSAVKFLDQTGTLCGFHARTCTRVAAELGAALCERGCRQRALEQRKVADWNERYRRGEHIIKEPDAAARARRQPVAAGARSGPGLRRQGVTQFFWRQRGWQVTAVDASPVGIKLAEEAARTDGVEVDWRVDDWKASWRRDYYG